MEGLAPPLEALICLRYEIEKGNSVKSALKNYLATKSFVRAQSRFRLLHWRAKEPSLHIKLSQLLRAYEAGENFPIFAVEKKPHRMALMNVLSRGLKGEPIHTYLLQLEEELREACEEDLETHIATLPVKMLFPLLLLQFPAFLLLLLGPLMMQILNSL